MSLDALQGCLAAEHAAVYGYGVLGGVLAGTTAPDSADQVLAAATYVEHRRRRDDLTALITSRETEPVAADPAYEISGKVATPAQCRALARLLEDRCAQTYADAVSRCVGSDRELTARGLTASALRLVSWGADPEPFPGLAEF